MYRPVPEPLRLARAVGALCRKDFQVALTYRVGFVLSVGAVLWTSVTFRFISELVSGGGFPAGTDYFDFVVVGLALSGVLQTAGSSAASSVRQDQVQGTLEIVATQPVSRLALGVGWCAYPTLHGLAVALVVVVASIPLGFRAVDPNLPVVAVVLGLSAVVFMAIGILGASIVVVIQQGTQIVNIVIAGLGLLSGTLFPTTVLPAGLEALAALSPLTYALRALRQAVLDGAGFNVVGGDLLVLAAFAAVLLPVAAATLEGAFRLARRRGSLSVF